MSNIENFKINDRESEYKTDIYNPNFESPIQKSNEHADTIDRNLVQFTELCSFLRLIIFQ